MQKYQNNVTSRTGDAVSGLQVTVSLAAGGLATIYSDNAGSPKANPITTDANGYFEFYAADGRYNITAGGGGYSDVLIADTVLIAEAATEAVSLAQTSAATATTAKNDAVAASGTAVAASDTAVANATTTTTKAAEAAASAVAADASQDGAETARTGAESARDAALIQAGVYVDEPTGRAAVADGQAFKVQGTGDVAAYEYRRVDAVTVSTLIATYPSSAAVEAVGDNLDARAPVSAASRFSHLLTDSLGHAAGRLRPNGTLELLASEMQELTLQTMNLTPDARGTVLKVDDSQGHVAWRIKEDGTVESTPSLRVYDGTTLVSGQVGGIEFGDNLTVSITTRGVKVDASGGGSTEAGSLSSLNQGVTKLDDPATWVDRTLVLTAGASLTVGLSGSASVLGFRVVKMTHLEAPIAPYYAYYSTDHAAGEGGVFLATASHPFGPWTPQGRVFYDASATQTETPEVVWDRWSGVYRLYYQVQNAKYGPSDSLSAIGSQSTLSAYSTDGVSWTKDPNFILDHLASYQYADGHTGYFYISETPDGFVGRSALGGGSIGLTTIWRHQGGPMGGLLKNTHIYNNWYSDYRDVGSNYEATYGTPEEGRRAIPFGAFGYNLRGARMGIGQCWYRRSGTDPADVIVVAGPITNDYRRFIGMPTPIWTPEEAWETEDVRFTNTFVDDGYIYVFLTMNNSGVPTASANVIGGFRHVV